MDLPPAYIAGWNACMRGIDARANPNPIDTESCGHWIMGWFDARESESDELLAPVAEGIA